MELMYVEDCCEILDSQRIPITASDRKDGEYPYYGANGIQDHVANYIFDDELVLLAEDGGNFGSKERPIAYRVSGKCWVNNHAHVLKPKVGLDVDYLCYSLMFYKVDGIVNGATRQKLTQAAMRKMQIPSRSIEEQKHIVDELNRITLIKEQRQQELQLLDDLIKARFIEMFGDPIDNEKNWPFELLQNVTTIVLGSTPRTNNDDYWNGDIKWISPAELSDESFYVYDTVKHITEEGVKSAGLKSFPANTVLFSTRAPIGKTAIAGCEMYCNQGFKNFICGPRLNPVYLYYLLRHKKEYFQNLGSGTTFRELSRGAIEKIAIAVPDMELQNKFEKIFRQVDKSKVVA